MTAPQGDAFRRADGVVELRLVATRLRRITLVMWVAVLAAIVASVAAVEPSQRVAVISVGAVLAVATALVGRALARRAVLVDGHRLGWSNGWSPKGRWWIELGEIVDVTDDRRRPMERIPYRTLILWARSGGMPPREARALARTSINARREMRARTDAGLRPFVVRASDLGREREHVLDTVIAPFVQPLQSSHPDRLPDRHPDRHPDRSRLWT